MVCIQEKKLGVLIMKYDVIFIGSGHAAWHGAQELARAGKRVALIEQEKVSGTCTNFGCNAKILLDGPAEIVTSLTQLPRYWDERCGEHCLA